MTVVHESEDEVEEDDEDAFNDDLPDLDAKQERYLMQKFATLWLNRIRPGMCTVYSFSISVDAV